MENNSNRSSGSSGVYGYLVDHQTLECDEIYAKPMVFTHACSYPDRFHKKHAFGDLKINSHASSFTIN